MARIWIGRVGSRDPVLFQEVWSARRDTQIRFLKLQPELIKQKHRPVAQFPTNSRAERHFGPPLDQRGPRHAVPTLLLRCFVHNFCTIPPEPDAQVSLRHKITELSPRCWTQPTRHDIRSEHLAGISRVLIDSTSGTLVRENPKNILTEHIPVIQSVILGNDVMENSVRKRWLTTCKVVCFNKKKISGLKKKLPSKSKLESAARRYKLLGHPAPQAILHVLSIDECCACDLANILSKPVSTVSQHLRMLMSAGFLRSQQEKKLVFYSLEPQIFRKNQRGGF